MIVVPTRRSKRSIQKLRWDVKGNYFKFPPALKAYSCKVVKYLTVRFLKRIL